MKLIEYFCKRFIAGAIRNLRNKSSDFATKQLLLGIDKCIHKGRKKMITKLLKFFGKVSILILLFVLFQMCNSNSTDPQNNDQPVDLTGSWELTTTIISNTCGLQDGETKTEIMYLTDTGGVLSIINFDGHWGDGAVDGTNMQFNGAETSDDLGCPATLLTEGTGSISAAEITGTFTTTVDFPDSCTNYSDCTIHSNFVMKKIEESPCLDRASFGDPQNSDYILPYPVGASYPVYQSYCWQTGGHRNQLAYDFTIPIGDTIVAARGGIVREVREDSPDNGQGYGEHNYVFIQHQDGTLAFYAHLMQFGVIVEPDDTVETGQNLAFSGNSGQSGIPHLHFGVYENYPPVEGVDIPINFRNAEGPLDSRGGLIRGEFYTALPY
jgi:hypothetical protein